MSLSDKIIPLAKAQKEIIQEFYNIAPANVIFDKKDRVDLWKKAVQRNISEREHIRNVCPALENQIQKSYKENHNIQSAVFSVCVYAQTYANMLKLDKFVICDKDSNFIPQNILNLIKSYNLFPRYVYSSENKDRMLIQAGGCNGVDSALITVVDLVIYTIEFKEPGAKTSEPDLPKYKEDGKINITKDFLHRYPQFESMLNEQKELNFFECMGSNIHNFSKESINIAVSNNYTKKYADVICTEDVDGYLVMIPSNQVQLWAEIEGEIRPAGRNHYRVWTPNKLEDFLKEQNATINEKTITIQKNKLGLRRERGGNGKISGYKINPLFFVYAKDCVDNGSTIRFDISKVRQLNPTIAGKLFFSNLKHLRVKSYYEKLF